MLDECGFLDLGFVGNRFTWSKHFADGHSIWERLDRGVVNASWFLKFPGTIVHHLHCTSSDHMPLYINLSGLEVSSRRKLFRFEEMWLSDERCGEVVEALWLSYHHGFSDSDILKRVDKCGRDLEWWNYNIFGNVRKELAKKKELLIRVELEAQVTGLNTRVRAFKEEINILLDREAHMWSQRSRTLWLKNGDRNTGFFHCRATRRFQKNVIRGIMDESNNWRVDPNDIAALMIKYYQDLFTSSKPNAQGADLDHIPNVITNHMNATLIAPFRDDEVKEALKQMAPFKAARPDGMPPLFYQHFWGWLIGM